MKLLTGDLYECATLHGLANCTISNSGDPPGSFHTGDVFVPHETLPDRWRLISRLDDVIDMSFSDSFVALPFEGRIRSRLLLEEVVVFFGNGRSKLCLLVFASEAAKGLVAEQVVERIWPNVEG